MPSSDLDPSLDMPATDRLRFRNLNVRRRDLEFLYLLYALILAGLTVALVVGTTRAGNPKPTSTAVILTVLVVGTLVFLRLWLKNRRRPERLEIDLTTRTYTEYRGGTDGISHDGSFNDFDHLLLASTDRMALLGAKVGTRAFWTVFLVWKDRNRPPFPLTEQPDGVRVLSKDSPRDRQRATADLERLGRLLDLPTSVSAEGENS